MGMTRHEISSQGSYKIEPSLATQNVRYAIREVTVLANRLAREGRRILYLNIGDPNVYDFDLVDEAKEAVHHALETRHCGYAPSEGLPEALSAIEADAVGRQHIRSIVGSFTGNGASECIDLALTALVNPGDNVLLPSPTYPLYETILNRLGVEIRFYKMKQEDGWQPDVAQIDSIVDERTRAIVVINPNNPTGAVYSEDRLRDIIEIAKEHRLLILNDEIYERLILGDSHHVPMASLDDSACFVTFNGLSKAYLGPGIRVGWGIVSGPEDALSEYFETIKRLMRARLCANHPFQYAVAPCLLGAQSHLPQLIEKLQRRRDCCMRWIDRIDGLSCAVPDGSFYAFVRVEGVKDDMAWCRALLESKGVVVVPGSGFGYREAEAGYFRIVFLPQEDVLEEAFSKIGEFMREYRAE